MFNSIFTMFVLMHVESRSGYQILCDWSYRQL